MVISTAETPTMGLLRLIGEGNRFVVPDHQRDYSWAEDEIEQLFSDVSEAISSRQDEYFIGLMVFMPKAQRELSILDGQQRLATAIITLASIRSWLKARGHDKDADQIQNDFIAVRELGKEDLEPRLILNQNNHPYFDEYVIREAPDSKIQKKLRELSRYDPSRRLLEAILFCRRKVEEVADADEKAEKLFSLVRFYQDNVKIVRLTVPSETNAYTVFETLNDRGLDLTVLDLVKNYLFGKAARGQRLRDIQARWTQMMANLVNVQADDFLKVWWTSRFGRIQTAQFFPKFKSQVNNWSRASKTSEDMLSASEQYAALEIADDPLWSDISKESKDRIRALKLLGAKQVHPVLLSSLAKIGKRELERLIRLLEVLIVRYQLIGGGRTGRLEIACAALAHQIWQGKISKAGEAKKTLKDVFPSDEEFREKFKSKQEKNNRKAVFILKRLENHVRLVERSTVSARELEPGSTLTLEHIFPNNPGSAWRSLIDSDSEIVEDCTHRLGNLCLLGSVNRALGNKSFDDKKGTYARSELILTKELSRYRTWNKSSIERRQNRIADLAVALWRLE